MFNRFFTTKTILISMLVFQLVWVFGIWITGATDNGQKLLVLGVVGILGFLLVKYLHTSFLETIGTWIDRWADNRRLFFLSLFIVMLVGGVLYAHFQRVWPFDEEYSYKRSQFLAEQGLEAFFGKYAQTNYLGNRHPPLIFLINGLFMGLFGSSLMTLRMVSLSFGLAMLSASYFLASNLYGRRTAVLTVLFLLSFPLVIRESTAGLLDVQATFFIVLSLLLALKLTEKPSWKIGLLLGLALGLGLLTKYIVMFVIPILLVYFLFQRNYRATLAPVILSFSVAGAMFLLWAWYGSQIGVRVPTVAGWSPSDLFISNQAATNDTSAEANPSVEEITITPGYFLVSDWGRGFLLNSLITKLPSGLGAYNLLLILFGVSILIHQKNSSDLIVLMWIGVASLLLILTLPDHRYFMIIFPALSISMARWMETQPAKDVGQITLLGAIYQISTLYLMIDWSRASELFIK